MGEFQITCESPIARANEDPIVSPGQKSAHAHNLFGPGTNLLYVGDTTQLTDAKCTSCNFEADRSLYWVPAMYQDKGGGNKVMLDSMLHVYYRTDQVLQASAEYDREAMNGLRLVIKPKPGVSRSQAQYRCFHGSEIYLTPDNKWPTGMQCKSLLASISSGDCWNEEKDSEDHQSHIVWSDEMTHICPEGYKRIPQIQVNAAYTFNETLSFTGDAMPLWFADGSKSDGFHADVITAWNLDSFDVVARTCAKMEPQADCIIQGQSGLSFIDRQTAAACNADITFPAQLVVNGDFESTGNGTHH